MSILYTSLLVGLAPEWLHVLYTVQTLYFLPTRYYTYKKKAWHYFLFDLCYYVNVLALLFIWVFPGSPVLWHSCYLLTHGSLASAVITWRNSLVFHDIDKVTSLYIHIYPPLVFTMICHFYPNAATRFPAVTTVMAPWKSLFLSAVIYSIWQGLYWKLVLVDRKAKVESGQRTTSFSFLLNDKRGVIGRMLQSVSPQYRLPGFMFGQLVYTVITELPAAFLLYNSPIASVIFLLVIFGVSVWNGAGFYIEVFGRKFERELEALRKELAETRSSAASHASSPVATPGHLPTDHDHGFMSSGVSVSSEMSGMDEASSEGMGSPIMIGGPGKPLDLKEGFKLDVVPNADESKKDRTMDLQTLVNTHMLSRPIRSLKDLEYACLNLSQAVDLRRHAMEDVIDILLIQEHYLFETLLVSDGLGEKIRDFLIAPWNKTYSLFPQPHFGLIKSFQPRLHHLKAVVTVPSKVTGLATYLEAVGAAIRSIQLSFQVVRKKAVKSNPKRPHKGEEFDSDAIFNRINCTSPQSKEEAQDLAGDLSRRICNMMEIYINFLLERKVSASVRQALIDSLHDASEAATSPTAIHRESSHPASIYVSAPHDALEFLGDTVENGQWLVVLAQRALRHLRQISLKHTILYNVVRRKLLELKEGFFHRSNHAQFLGSNYRIPLYAAELVNGIYIVYQVDCGAPAEQSHQVAQFIRVFDIDEIKDNLKFWRSVASQLHGRDAAYCRRCNARSIPRCKVPGINLIPPIIFDRESIETEESSHSSSTIDTSTQSEESFLELHRMLSLEKFVPYSSELIDAIENDAEGTFMFSMSPTERDIIDHRSSCLVLGRSGTGKTTTMMFKMLAFEMSARQAGSTSRQMFVTQSPALAEKVKAYYGRLKKQSLDLDSENQDLSSPVDDDFTLDDLRTRDRVNTAALPECWTKLRDEDFPIFLSYDELCNLLAADLELYYESEMPSVTTFGFKIQKGRKQGRITFSRFMSRIWPHLKRNDIDPLLLFNEIVGVIKGSEASLSFESGFLDRAAYENLSTRTYPVFAGQRDLVYDLFLSYLRFKPKGSWDAAERSHELIREWKKMALAPSIDFIYVDEAQDNLLIDTSLLRSLCPNPHGLFFAGDTAQTVSAGSTFRFNDLKAFLYRLEAQDPRVTSQKRKAVEPKFFSLSINYRSHGGIIDAAAFLVSSLARFFPGSIDILAPERALVRGPKPVFFLGRGFETPFEAFISDRENCEIEFGADQVIIVRDESSCQALRGKIGRRSGMVMTLYASKGQEFNDVRGQLYFYAQLLITDTSHLQVLLYDFFEDSQASPKHWKALLKATRSANLKDTGQLDAILQTELKSFYVGMTRARERVWFWDSGSKGEAFQSALVEHNLARAASILEAPLCMGVRSSKREWALRGKECFRREDYFNASLAFEQAGLAWWKSVADAFERKQKAERLPTRDLFRNRALRQSAEDISTCGEVAPNLKDQTILFETAARCYVEAKEYKGAAALFERLQRYNDAAWNYRLAGSFKKAIAIVETFRDQVNPELAQNVKDVGAVVFVRTGGKESAKSLFTTSDEYLQFLKENGFHDQHLQVLIDLSRHEEAALALLRLNRRSEAIHHFLLAGGRHSKREAADCLIESIWLHISFGTPAITVSAVRGKQCEELISLSSRCVLSTAQQAVVDVVKAARSEDAKQLETLAQTLSSNQPHAAILSLEIYLHFEATHPLGRNPLNIDCAIDSIRTYLLFGRTIRRAAQLPNIARRQDFQSLFGLASDRTRSETADVPDGVVALPHSAIYNRAVRDIPRKRGIKAETGILLPVDTASQYIVQALLCRYNVVAAPLLRALEESMKRSPFTICLYPARNGRCLMGPCDRHHPSEKEFSVEGFNQRVELHLLVVAALECLNTNPAAEREFYQQMWFQRLIETCYPPDDRLGNISWLKPSLIPIYPSLISAAKIWCEDVYRTMKLRGAYFMTNATGCAMFGSVLDSRNAARYLGQGSWRHDRPRPTSYYHMTRGLQWFLRGFIHRHIHGVEFIRSLVTSGLRIDIFTLVSFAEEVIGHLIYSRLRLCSKEVILPRSWAIRACQHGTLQMAEELGSIPCDLIDTLSQLVEIFQTGDAGGLHYRGQPVSQITRILKVSAIVKICRMLVFVGENMGGPDMKDNILAVFQRANARDKLPHARYLAFLKATTWTELIQALEASSQGSSIDPFLLLIDGFENRPRTRNRSIKGADLIHSTSDEELLSKLGASLLDTTVLPETGPGSEISSQSSGVRGIPNGLEMGPPALNSTEANGGDLMQWTEEERRAESKIAAWYKRHRRRMEGGLGDPLWSAYNDRSKDLEATSRPTRKYKIYMRSLVPKVSAYLQGVAQRLEKANDGLNAQASSVPHEQLDEIRSKSKVIRTLMRDAKALQRSIGPQSLLHTSLDLQSLKAEVNKVKDLRVAVIDVCPAVEELEIEYRDSVEFMLFGRRLKVSLLRPTLNTSDLFVGPNGVLA
ncbi:hypothetical protein FRB90_011077 [Tulasnella sp. 427]|nr:hypothetical protein FRB90_011077 [Tulasnella sp. 427]